MELVFIDTAVLLKKAQTMHGASQRFPDTGAVIGALEACSQAASLTPSSSIGSSQDTIQDLEGQAGSSSSSNSGRPSPIGLPESPRLAALSWLEGEMNRIESELIPVSNSPLFKQNITELLNVVSLVRRYKWPKNECIVLFKDKSGLDQSEVKFEKGQRYTFQDCGAEDRLAVYRYHKIEKDKNTDYHSTLLGYRLKTECPSDYRDNLNTIDMGALRTLSEDIARLRLQDVVQGNNGDCGFLASLQALICTNKLELLKDFISLKGAYLKVKPKNQDAFLMEAALKDGSKLKSIVGKGHTSYPSSLVVRILEQATALAFAQKISFTNRMTSLEGISPTDVLAILVGEDYQKVDTANNGIQSIVKKSCFPWDIIQTDTALPLSSNAYKGPFSRQLFDFFQESELVGVLQNCFNISGFHFDRQEKAVLATLCFSNSVQNKDFKTSKNITGMNITYNDLNESQGFLKRSIIRNEKLCESEDSLGLPENAPFSPQWKNLVSIYGGDVSDLNLVQIPKQQAKIRFAKELIEIFNRLKDKVAVGVDIKNEHLSALNTYFKERYFAENPALDLDSLGFYLSLKNWQEKNQCVLLGSKQKEDLPKGVAQVVDSHWYTFKSVELDGEAITVKLLNPHGGSKRECDYTAAEIHANFDTWVLPAG